MPPVQATEKKTHMPTTSKKSAAKARHGFDTMSPAQHKKIARLGGKAAAASANRGKNGQFRSGKARR
jgi:hypothetical protein